MRRARLALAAVTLSVSAPLRGQGVAVGASVSSFTLRETTGQNSSGGHGVGVSVGWTHAKLGIRVDVSRVPLSPDDTLRTAFTIVQFDGRVSYRIRPALDVELGLSRRTISPEFATQDVGAVSLGVRSEGQLGQVAGVWARGALLPLVRFNGGGTSGTAVEVGLGTWVSLAHGRLRAELDYRLQRVDRSVQGAPLPLQMGVTRLGVMLGL